MCSTTVFLWSVPGTHRHTSPFPLFQLATWLHLLLASSDIEEAMKASRLFLSHSLSQLPLASWRTSMYLVVPNLQAYLYFCILKIPSFHIFLSRKLCYLSICILYEINGHTGTLLNDMIVLLFLFSVDSLISLIFFGFCHVSSHRVIEIVIKTLRHVFRSSRPSLCTWRGVFHSTAHILVWFALLRGYFFSVDSCPQSIQDGHFTGYLKLYRRNLDLQYSKTEFLKLIRCNAWM